MRVYYFLILLSSAYAIFPALVVLAQDGQIPAGFESYLSRPGILEIKPTEHGNLGADWQKLRRAHVEAVALLLEMNPDKEIYFLARDAELLYDASIFLAKDDPALAKRLHLLNISRANMRAEHVKEYLSQEGISETALKSGKKILFVDTGFAGTIPETLTEYFPSELRKNIKTHLMASSNPLHPSTRVFLAAINPVAPSLNPGEMHGTIVSYEHIARYTDRSSGFALVNGRWHPTSSVAGTADGLVSKAAAKQYMEDLIYYLNQDDTKRLFEERRILWKNLRLLGETGNMALLSKELKKILGQDKLGPFAEAIVRDFVDLANKNMLARDLPLIALEDLGLNTLVDNSNNKLLLMKKIPEWKPYLEDPVNGIPKLLKAKDFATLGAIVDSLSYDAEFMRLLAASLGDPTNYSMETKKFIKMLIGKEDSLIMQNLAWYTFSSPGTLEMKDLLRMLIEKGDQSTLNLVAMNVFSQPHAKEMENLLQLLVERGDQRVLQSLAEGIFALPHGSEMRDSMRFLIKKADGETRGAVARLVFSKPHTRGMNDLIRLLIEKSDSKEMRGLSYFLFSTFHAEERAELLPLIIEKADTAS